MRLAAYLIAAATIAIIAFPDRSMSKCTLTHSFDVCHQILNR